MLAILTTHPIQYQVPLWQALAKDSSVPFEVWYLTSHGTQSSHDREFGKEFAWDLEMLSGYPHRFLDVMPNATPSSFWKCRLKEKLRDRLRDTGVRALWIQGWQVAAYWQAVWEAKAAGVEVWLRGESNDLAPVAWWKSAAKRVALGQLFNRVDRFLYIGSANRRLYEKFGVPAGKLFPAPYAVDNERFRLQAEAIRGSRSPASAQGYGVAGRTEIRGQWGIPTDAFCILFCGKFIPKKRPMDLINAAQLLLSSDSQLHAPGSMHRNLHLLFVGSGHLGVQMRAACNVVFDADASASRRSETIFHLPSSNSQNPRASFAGFMNQTEISNAYVAADVLVLPSDYRETWGLVVNEAMASGLPCIISDQCGCAEDLGCNPNLTYQCGNIRLLADAIRNLMSSLSDHTDFHRMLIHYSFATTLDSVVSAFKASSHSAK